MHIFVSMIRHFIIAAIFYFPLISFAQQPDSEEGFRDYFAGHKDSLDQIEGIWIVSTTQEFYRYDTLYSVDKYPRAAKVAIIRNEEAFLSFNLAGEPFDVSFFLTDVKGVYMYKNYFRSTMEYSNTEALISKSGEMQYTYEFPDAYLRLQLADSYEEGTRVVNQLSWRKIFPEGER